MSTTYYFQVSEGVSDREFVSWVCRCSGWRRYACAENNRKKQVLADADRKNFVHLGKKPLVGSDGERYGYFERFGSNDVGGLPDVLGAFDEHDDDQVQRVFGNADINDDDEDANDPGEDEYWKHH